MPETKNTKLALRCFTLAVLSFGLFFLSRDSTKASLSAPQTRPKPPEASVARQDDSPLRLLNTFVEYEPGTFRLKVMAQNQSGKKIRAYAVAVDAGPESRANFANLTSAASVLRPTQVKTLDFAFSENEAPKLATFFVDFVEFDDGTTWGRDMYNSRDMLAGWREGAKDERKRLRALLKSKGAPAVFDAVREEVPDDIGAEPTVKHSQAWLIGYGSGVASVRYHLRQNLQAGDAAGAEKELAKPFDLSEEQPR